MTFGTREDGSGYLELTKEEVEALKARKPVVKHTGDCNGHAKITVKLTRPRSKVDRFKGFPLPSFLLLDSDRQRWEDGLPMILTPKTFKDLMYSHHSAEIRCLNTGKLARKLTVQGDRVQIDALAPPIVSVPLDTEIRYGKCYGWGDRGNFIFSCPEVENAKICGEGDNIVYPDGMIRSIMAE